MGRRFKVEGRPNSFVERDGTGQFKNWVNIGDSLRADRRTQASTTVKPGYGHQGDQKRRRPRNPFGRKKKLRIFDVGGHPRYAVGTQINKPLRTTMSLDYAKGLVAQFKRNFPFRLR